MHKLRYLGIWTFKQYFKVFNLLSISHEVIIRFKSNHSTFYIRKLGLDLSKLFSKCFQRALLFISISKSLHLFKINLSFRYELFHRFNVSLKFMGHFSRGLSGFNLVFLLIFRSFNKILKSFADLYCQKSIFTVSLIMPIA